MTTTCKIKNTTLPPLLGMSPQCRGINPSPQRSLPQSVEIRRLHFHKSPLLYIASFTTVISILHDGCGDSSPQLLQQQPTEYIFDDRGAVSYSMSMVPMGIVACQKNNIWDAETASKQTISKILRIEGEQHHMLWSPTRQNHFSLIHS